LDSLLDFRSLVSLSADRFPPIWSSYLIPSDSKIALPGKFGRLLLTKKVVTAFLLGTQVPVIEETNKLTIRLPLKHAFLGTQNVVLKKEGFVPLVYSLDQLPTQIPIRQYGRSSAAYSRAFHTHRSGYKLLRMNSNGLYPTSTFDHFSWNHP